MNEIRLLGKDDIEIRVAQTTTDKKGVVKASLLLYKNARVDMKILDELYGPFGWKRSHKLLGDRLYCIVEVWDGEKKEWIAKEDVGTESNTEAEKGQASDSFKRACVNWGIGRELYTAPRISVELDDREWLKMQNGSIRVWTSFRVSEIDYNKDDRSITRLVVSDNNGNVRFEYGGEQQQPKKKAAAKKAVPASKVASLAPEKYDAWVSAAARNIATKAGIPARDGFVRNFAPTEDELAAFDEAVLHFRLDNGIKATDNNTNNENAR